MNAPSSLLTTRWSRSTALTPDQAQWFYLNHYFYRCVDAGYSLKPILLLTGEQGSGKSTGIEVQLAVRAGRKVEPQALPEKKDIGAAASTRSLLAWDNVDGIDDTALSDTLCLIATSGDMDMREYYTTAKLRTVPMRNHAMLTARVNSFKRSDVMRRVIALEVASPEEGASQVTKDGLIKEVLAARAAILAETLIRTQNILIAYQQHAQDQSSFFTQMSEYERYTLICAAYEGRLAYARQAWASYMESYREEIADRSGVVYGVRLWLGSDPGNNVGREIKAEELFSDLQSLYIELGLPFPWRVPKGFATILGNERTALRNVCVEKHHHRLHGNSYTFSPDEYQVAELREQYIRTLKSFGKRPSRDTNGLEWQAKQEGHKLRRESENEIQREQEHWAYLDDEEERAADCRRVRG